MTVKTTDVRGTPQWLYDALNDEFGFTIDVCASRAMHKHVNWIGPDHRSPRRRDSLTVDWDLDYAKYGRRPVAFCNMPYSAGNIPRWCARAQQQAQDRRVTSVLLLPADISTGWYQAYVHGGERWFLRRRLNFDGAPLDRQGKKTSAKFGSVIRIFRPASKYWYVG